MIVDDEYTFDEAILVLTGPDLDMDRNEAFRVLGKAILNEVKVTRGAKVTPVTVTFAPEVHDGKYFYIELPEDARPGRPQ